MTQRNYVLAFDTANEVIAVGLGRLNAQDKTVEDRLLASQSAHPPHLPTFIAFIDVFLHLRIV